jgi:hypothetical protein
MGRVLRVACSGQIHVALFLGEARLTLENGTASVLVEPGEHPLIWVVTGQIGASYSLTVASPPTAAFHLSAVIGESGRDAGLRWISM